MRRALPFAILAGCLGVGVLPALAADRTVSATATRWNPAEFAVTPADTVTWVNGSGVRHNLHVDGVKVAESAAAPADPDWTYAKQYPARAGAYSFACTLHPGMAGRFYVNASGTVPSPSPTASPTTSPAPTGTAYPGGTAPSTTPSGGNPIAPSGGPAVSSFRVRAAQGSFCTRRSARCRRPGVFLRLDLGAADPVRARGTLRRGTRRVRAVSLLVRPGSRRVRLPGRRLKPGRYALTLTAGEITRRVRFRVRAA